jgi:hypothetical protein
MGRRHFGASLPAGRGNLSGVRPGLFTALNLLPSIDPIPLDISFSLLTEFDPTLANLPYGRTVFAANPEFA